MTRLVAVVAAVTAAWAASGGRRPALRRLHLPPRVAPPVRAVALVGPGALAAFAVGVPFLVLVAVGAGVGGLAGLWRRRRHRSVARGRDAEVILICFALAAELRAGRTPADALAATAPQLRELRTGVADAARAVGHGAQVHDELASLAAKVQCARLLTVTAVWAASATTGARIADVLERVGRGLAHDDEAAGELDALCAGPRATAWVLCLLPVFAAGLGTAIGASPLPVLLHTRLGAALSGAAALLDVVGVLWVRRLTAGALFG